MNWPPLSRECSEAIADCLKTVVQEKPEDLLEFVAQRLSNKSGWNPKEFEEHFEECKRRPRTYVLEDQCPTDQDPLVWVPMRYNDETIFETLRERAADLAQEMLSQTQCTLNMEDMSNMARVAFPELSYLRGSPQEQTVMLTLRAIYLGCAGYNDVLDVSLRDEDPMLSFSSYGLMVWLRNVLRQTINTEEMFESFCVACLLPVLGNHEGFQKKYGGGLQGEKAILHAIDHEIESLPSFQRLHQDYQQLVEAFLHTNFSLQSLLTAEICPGQLAKVKEITELNRGVVLDRAEGGSIGSNQYDPNEVARGFGVAFFLCVIAVEHAVKNSNVVTPDEDLEIIRLGSQSLMAVDKYNAPKAYELFLKKRASLVEWRLGKDNVLQHAIVRLCCLAGFTDVAAWNAMQSAAEGLSERESETLQNELARKDGIEVLPAYFPCDAGALLKAGYSNESVTLAGALKILARVLDETARSFDKTLKEKIVNISFSGFARRAQEFESAGIPFEDSPFVIETVAGELMVRVGGA